MRTLALLVLTPLAVADFDNEQPPYFKHHHSARFVGWETFQGGEPWAPDHPDSEPGNTSQLRFLWPTQWSIGASGNLCYSNASFNYGYIDDQVTDVSVKEIVLQISYRGEIALDSFTIEWTFFDEKALAQPSEVVVLENLPGEKEVLVRFETGHLRHDQPWWGGYENDGLRDYSIYFQIPAGDGCIDAVHLDSRTELGLDYRVSRCDDPVLNSRDVYNMGPRGAYIDATGSSRVIDNEFLLMAQGLPFNQPTLFLASQAEDYLVAPGGSMGNLCLAGPIIRFAGQAGSSGDSGSLQIALDLNALPGSPPVPVQPGDRWFFQAWYRDDYLGPTSNFTDVLAVTFH